ncbi:dTMP kinase [Metamycoplasma subdolum]|uniref:Thymidylate kinase n=1 Tax=Metamycoplasma subdolum TaxID=92407 RepID=A0A3M0A1U8_9BACT|nr:dTMP kinase [Metamycoplasma subdolum]RMA78627.1 dTMP kinase [Metamycoplasma subdolum]WPB50771.1 dTMP kinase [Metamycoplasma subdolum]
MKKGKFIVIEGMDGSGKSTIVEMLKKQVAKDKKDDQIIFTREPGSAFSKEAEKIRNLILDNNNEFSTMADAMLFATGRRINLEKGIWPALEAGKTVISDRYWHSSFVYQGILGKVGLDKVKTLNKIATDNSNPDLVIFFDLKPEISLSRLTKLRDKMDRLEHNNLSYYEKLRDAYHEVIKDDPEIFRVIDSNCTIEELYQKVVNILKKEGIF